MNPDSFVQWLDSFGAAWTGLDPVRLAALFAPNVIFQETPFTDPLRGRDEVAAYWTATLRTQNMVDFGYEILSVTPNMGIAQWWASFVRTAADVESAQVKLDGVAIIALDTQGLCLSFHQWWHALETSVE